MQVVLENVLCNEPVFFALLYGAIFTGLIRRCRPRFLYTPLHMPDMTTTPLPSLFVSHGAPLLAIDPGTSGPAPTRRGGALLADSPVRGVVVMSPHWMAATPTVMTHPQPATWHDFGGFPPALYQLQYPAPGNPALAAEVLQAFEAAGIATDTDSERPFDHGAWVPLMHLFPQATVPVVQVALPHGAGPAEVLALGQALLSLRSQGRWSGGTGSMTHNLSRVFRRRARGAGQPGRALRGRVFPLGRGCHHPPRRGRLARLPPPGTPRAACAPDRRPFPAAVFCAGRRGLGGRCFTPGELPQPRGDVRAAGDGLVRALY